ncbi:hypothetical protein EB796_007104 [Bugula neritina]|uniref:Uncharacterized protein n=1 Tax=Bugula neritina TaxID=10212 RepID=A0A7J7K9R2_BUGNE|nr:hypothetical protein EB796_007104 [Bugula neritina]
MIEGVAENQLREGRGAMESCWCIESKEVTEEKAPVVSLDDLFRKTTTEPAIYWLPLTDEKIEQKAKEREERSKAYRERKEMEIKEKEAKAEERKKEIEERRRKEREERKSPSPRRRLRSPSPRHHRFVGEGRQARLVALEAGVVNQGVALVPREWLGVA